MSDLASRLDVPVGSEFDGFAVFVVGGAVRDAMRGMQPEDIDLMAVPRPGEVDDPVSILDDRMTMIDPASTIPVFEDSEGREVALPRTEEDAGDGHKGFDMSVVPAGTPVPEAVRVDLKRRDLTVNAMAFDVRSGELFDPFDGAEDLEAGVARHVSEAFREDPLRVVRLARFAPRLNADIAPVTLRLARNVSRNPVTPNTQLGVIAREIAHRDPEVADSLRHVAETLPDDVGRQPAVEIVERAVDADALARFDVLSRLEEEMSQIEALPTERVTKELRKVVRQAGGRAGRFFRVLREVNALGDAFPVVAGLDDGEFEAFVATVDEAAPNGFDAVLAAVGDLLGPNAEAFVAEQDIGRQEQATVLTGRDSLVEVARFDELDARHAVDVFDRIGGERGAPSRTFLEAAEARARVTGAVFDRAAVANRLAEAEEAFEEVGGQEVFEREGIQPGEVPGERIGELIAEHRARRLAD